MKNGSLTGVGLVTGMHFNEVYLYIYNLLLLFSLTRVKYDTSTIRQRRCDVVVRAHVWQVSSSIRSALLFLFFSSELCVRVSVRVAMPA